MSRVIGVNKTSNDAEQITLTNGDTFVSITAPSGDPRIALFNATITPEQATDLAIGLLNAATNVREASHGNTERAQYDDTRRAHNAIAYLPPVQVPGNELHELLKSLSQTDGDMKAAIAKFKKAIGR